MCRGERAAQQQLALAQAEASDHRNAGDSRVAELSKQLAEAQREASGLRGRMEPLLSECNAYRKVCAVVVALRPCGCTGVY